MGKKHLKSNLAYDRAPFQSNVGLRRVIANQEMDKDLNLQHIFTSGFQYEARY